MKVYSIGFTKKKAEQFFNFLRGEEINRLIDVRLNNISQLAGFAKRDDLVFFLKELCEIDYVHLPDLAPTKDILDAYKKGNMQWIEYEDKFLNLMAKRNIERIEKSIVQNGCLLCSEHEPHHCHRRLVIDYLNDSWDANFTVKHLY
ncbi:MAG: DUF488 domain-containing protein [Kangiellaceae bacterium]|nr:DUF488 domain-containing protein [Kangiellaceae bacterium]MCW8998848.1 DUF488 domain-containing protein [Kangiellaceae bacterium]